MSTVSNTDTGLGIQTAPSPAPAQSRPFYWSVRRELWEHRSIWIAPLAVSGFVLFGFLIRLARLPALIRTVSTLSPLKQTFAYATPFAAAAAAIAATGLIVAVFYCLGALNGERRDRSILFWKSLPVSDATAVLAKTCVPFLIVPSVIFVVTILTHLIMLLIGSVVLMASGLDASAIWTHWPIAKMMLLLVYLLMVVTLWYAPIYGWLLIVSAWARKMTILWAVLPPLGVAIVERIALDTSWFGKLINFRISGFVQEAFVAMPHKAHESIQIVDPLQLMAPMKFAASPGLWVGLLFAAAFIAGAVWLRRDREPV